MWYYITIKIMLEKYFYSYRKVIDILPKYNKKYI